MSLPHHAVASTDLPLTLRTLGGASLVSPDGRQLLGQGKPLALLAYLASSPRRAAGREHLIDLLWADVDPDKARHALRQTIWYLRQLLGQSIVTTQGDTLTLAAGVLVDRDAFLAAIESGDLSAATTIYRGTFLDGFAAPGGVEFEHWADLERERLRQTFLRAAESVIRGWLNEGHAREALELARRAHLAAPEQERAWRLLFETMVQSGDRLALTLEADRFLAELEQTGRQPEPATRALLEQASVASRYTASDTGPTTLAGELVGREREFATILQAWQRQGSRHHLHVTAAAGLGKTRLLGDVNARLRTLGARVVTLRVHPGQRGISCSFAAELVAALAALPGAAGVSPSSAGTLVALNPTLSARFSAPADNATGDDAARRRAAALLELFRTVSEEARFALLLDDTHWLDPASRQMLRVLFEQTSESRTLVVTASRLSGPNSLETEHSQRIDLKPLTPEQTGQLIASIGQLPDEGWTRSLPEAVTRAAGGTPLLVLETLQLSLERRWLSLTERTWGCPDPIALAHGLESGSALRHRVARLERDERWLLLLTALAGQPLPLDGLITASGRPREATEAALGALEQRGFVLRSGEEWQPAHDEIAAEAEGAATSEELRAANAGLGRMYLMTAGGSRMRLRGAGQHLLAAEAHHDLRTAFLRYLRSAREEGDGRRVAFLAQEFLGDQPARAGTELVRTLGRLNRMRYSAARRLTIAGIFVLGVLATAAAFWRTAQPDMVLYGRTVDSDGRVAYWAIPLQRDLWRGSDPFREQPKPHRVRGAPYDVPGVNYLLKRPGREQWVTTIAVDDGGTNDIFLIGEYGYRKRLTTTPRDDSPMSWSPDGRLLAIVTARWSPQDGDDYDIAVLDPEGGEPRRIAGGPEMELGGYWSPDGTRIAFLREWKTRPAPGEACWATLDSQPVEHCVVPSTGFLTDVTGWTDPAHMLAVIDSAGHSLLVRLNAENGAVTVLRHDVTKGVASPDGNWIMVQARTRREAGSFFSVFPSDAPEMSARIPGTIPPLQAYMGWGEPSTERMLDSVGIDSFPSPVPLGVTTQLHVVGWGPRGQNILMLIPPRWQTSDSSIATIDDRGLLKPLLPGRVRVIASVGGWRTGSAQVTIAGHSATTVLREDWDERWQDRWFSLGDPLPTLATGPGNVRAFWNHGDGRYTSFGLSRERWKADAGLGVEVEASTPVNRGQWQHWAVIFWDVGTNEQILAASRNIEFPPPELYRQDRNCEVAYPGREGMSGLERLSVYAAGAPLAQGPVGPWIRHVPWYKVRVQVLPDGRCGVAINGVPVWLSDTRINLDAPLRLALGTSSAGALVLHGPLEVWQGVKPDIDWSVLDTLDGRPVPLPERPSRPASSTPRALKPTSDRR